MAAPSYFTPFRLRLEFLGAFPQSAQRFQTVELYVKPQDFDALAGLDLSNALLSATGFCFGQGVLIARHNINTLPQNQYWTRINLAQPLAGPIQDETSYTLAILTRDPNTREWSRPQNNISLSIAAAPKGQNYVWAKGIKLNPSDWTAGENRAAWLFGAWPAPSEDRFLSVLGVEDVPVRVRDFQVTGGLTNTVAFGDVWAVLAERYPVEVENANPSSLLPNKGFAANIGNVYYSENNNPPPRALIRGNIGPGLEAIAGLPGGGNIRAAAAILRGLSRIQARLPSDATLDVCRAIVQEIQDVFFGGRVPGPIAHLDPNQPPLPLPPVLPSPWAYQEAEMGLPALEPRGCFENPPVVSEWPLTRQRIDNQDVVVAAPRDMSEARDVSRVLWAYPAHIDLLDPLEPSLGPTAFSSILKEAHYPGGGGGGNINPSVSKVTFYAWEGRDKDRLPAYPARQTTLGSTTSNGSGQGNDKAATPLPDATKDRVTLVLDKDVLDKTALPGATSVRVVYTTKQAGVATPEMPANQSYKSFPCYTRFTPALFGETEEVEEDAASVSASTGLGIGIGAGTKQSGTERPGEVMLASSDASLLLDALRVAGNADPANPLIGPLIDNIMDVLADARVMQGADVSLLNTSSNNAWAVSTSAFVKVTPGASVLLQAANATETPATSAKSTFTASVPGVPQVIPANARLRFAGRAYSVAGAKAQGFPVALGLRALSGDVVWKSFKARVGAEMSLTFSPLDFLNPADPLSQGSTTWSPLSEENGETAASSYGVGVALRSLPLATSANTNTTTNTNANVFVADVISYQAGQAGEFTARLNFKTMGDNGGIYLLCNLQGGPLLLTATDAHGWLFEAVLHPDRTLSQNPGGGLVEVFFGRDAFTPAAAQINTGTPPPLLNAPLQSLELSTAPWLNVGTPQAVLSLALISLVSLKQYYEAPNAAITGITFVLPDNTSLLVDTLSVTGVSDTSFPYPGAFHWLTGNARLTPYGLFLEGQGPYAGPVVVTGQDPLLYALTDDFGAASAVFELIGAAQAWWGRNLTSDKSLTLGGDLPNVIPPGKIPGSRGLSGALGGVAPIYVPNQHNAAYWGQANQFSWRSPLGETNPLGPLGSLGLESFSCKEVMGLYYNLANYWSAAVSGGVKYPWSQVVAVLHRFRGAVAYFYDACYQPQDPALFIGGFGKNGMTLGYSLGGVALALGAMILCYESGFKDEATYKLISKLYNTLLAYRTKPFADAGAAEEAAQREESEKGGAGSGKAHAFFNKDAATLDFGGGFQSWPNLPPDGPFVLGAEDYGHVLNALGLISQYLSDVDTLRAFYPLPAGTAG